ncbi:MAG: KOW domain-containing RNA-binding protein [Thermoclostridium sp.]|nr:KOW domain-containing RNA-binding protein [Thermoclostridium sp.]
MDVLNPAIGRAAYSKAGRDKGKLFIVVGIVNEDFVLIADGDLRPAERPKKKRLKHLRFINQAAGAIVEKVSSGNRFVSADLREAIREIQQLLDG